MWSSNENHSLQFPFELLYTALSPQQIHADRRVQPVGVVNWPFTLYNARYTKRSPTHKMSGGEGGAEGKRVEVRGGRITKDVQQQARQRESPVVSELLVAARKGFTEQVIQLLRQDPDKAAVTDKV